MNTKTGWIIVTVAGVIIVAAAVWLLRVPSANNVPIPRETQENGAAGSGATHRVKMKDNAFAPEELSIKAGDTVIFDNEDEVAHWPASGVHPTHLLCPGFDALKALEQGESYSFTFANPGTCPMHDHLLPSMTGKIIVE